MPFDAVYLSPHLDDAVFSAGGAIARDVSVGRRVAVATLFSDGADADARREEDQAALAVLGVARIDLALPDAQRRARGHLFAPLDARDATLVGEVRAAIVTLLDGAPAIAPLGAGRHVDHQLVHAACAALPGVRFYEDLPYAFCAPLLSRRLDELAGVERGRSIAELRAIARWWRARPFFRQLAPRPFLPLASAMVAWRETRRAPAATGAALTDETIDVGAFLEKKIAAIAAYRSQWPQFFATLDEWRAALVAHGAIERQWKR